MPVSKHLLDFRFCELKKLEHCDPKTLGFQDPNGLLENGTDIGRPSPQGDPGAGPGPSGIPPAGDTSRETWRKKQVPDPHGKAGAGNMSGQQKIKGDNLHLDKK